MVHNDHGLSHLRRVGRPVRRYADLTVGPSRPDVTCGPRIRRQVDVQVKVVQTNNNNSNKLPML
jgi:hypothetical protein